MEEMREMYRNLGISDKIYDYSNDILEGLKERFDNIDKNAEYNQLKVINAMQKNRVAEMHLSGTTGYGYNDSGRDTLEQVYADIFKTESALVRPQITCGTHALNVALSANLRPGDDSLKAACSTHSFVPAIYPPHGARPPPGFLINEPTTISAPA